MDGGNPSFTFFFFNHWDTQPTRSASIDRNLAVELFDRKLDWIRETSRGLIGTKRKSHVVQRCPKSTNDWMRRILVRRHPVWTPGSRAVGEHRAIILEWIGGSSGKIPSNLIPLGAPGMMHCYASGSRQKPPLRRGQAPEKRALQSYVTEECPSSW